LCTRSLSLRLREKQSASVTEHSVYGEVVMPKLTVANGLPIVMARF
jgi:hypothetical protein